MRRSKRVKRSSPSVNTKEELDDLSKANDSLEEAELVHKNAQLAANAETDAPKTKPDTVNSDEKIADGASEDEIPTSAGHYGTQAVHSVPGGYNSLKTFNGQYYTGMAVGQSHMWHYEPGVWTETKREPDLWDINYKTNKRRARNAPEGSGAPVGTEYHWMIIGHQHVKKIDANTYETKLSGSKYKLCHKGANASSWSIPTVKGQRNREVELLDDAKRRVLNLPPVLGSEKVKVKKEETGQRKLDDLFAKSSKLKQNI